jgi:hypothetical protein
MMEIILGFLGFMVIYPSAFVVCGFFILLALIYILDAMQKSSAAFQRLRQIKALKDILPIGLAGFVGGACIGAAFNLMPAIALASKFHIPIVEIFNFSITSMFTVSSSTSFTAVIGFFVGSAFGVYRSSQKWNSCYICEDRFARYKSRANTSPFEACKLCDYEVLVGKP